MFQSGNASEAKPLKDKSSDLKKSSKDLAAGLEDWKKKINSYLLQIPNIPHKDVPAGSDEKDNKIIYESNISLNKNLTEPHWDLAKKYDLYVEYSNFDNINFGILGSKSEETDYRRTFFGCDSGFYSAAETKTKNIVTRGSGNLEETCSVGFNDEGDFASLSNKFYYTDWG